MTKNILHDVRCILLDVDGTLVDSNEFHVEAWTKAFYRYGHFVTAATVRNQIGKGADQLVPTLLPNVTDAELQAIAHAHDQIFRSTYLEQVRAFDGAHEFVATLDRRGVSVVLASSGKRAEVDHYIQLLDIENFLAASTSADDVEKSKPAADIFAVALSKVASTAPAQARAVGDTPYDVIAAAKCGIATLAVLSGGFSEHVLRSAGAHEVYPAVRDLLDSINANETNKRHAE